MNGRDWQGTPPCLFNIVTGFFPETSPKETWATNPRPLLVCGVARDPTNGMYFCRVAYGTSKKLHLAKDDDIVIGNMSIMNQLCLKHPTRFVTHSGSQMVIMPWINEFFRPWSGKKTPVLSTLPEDMQRFLGHVLSELPDLPQF